MTVRHPTILLVEDNDDQRAALAVLMQAKGYDVAVAADGIEALQALRENDPPTLVLLDLGLPRMNGWQLRREMLRDDKLASVPVVLVSGESDLDQIAKSLSVAGYLQKPHRLESLFQLLEDHCRAENLREAQLPRRSALAEEGFSSCPEDEGWEDRLNAL